MAVAMPEGLVFDASGLVPVVAQDRASGDVLMLAWANTEALARTADTGVAHFWSRSRKALWRKGETSGHELRVVEARADCDRDTLLLVVEPTGPACHTGARTCFGEASATAAGMLEELRRVVAERAQAPAEESYTARLLAKGPDQVLKKIGEEATEVVLAARVQSDERLAEETADLLYHLLVALHQRGLPLARVMDELRKRMSPRARSVGTPREGSALASADPSSPDSTAAPQDDRES
jgi:phosphoribosyl-ATP pyrophosphohydrolase/phosphoribosyl-AMP cyclohydrolase